MQERRRATEARRGVRELTFGPAWRRGGVISCGRYPAGVADTARLTVAVRGARSIAITGAVPPSPPVSARR